MAFYLYTFLLAFPTDGCKKSDKNACYSPSIWIIAKAPWDAWIILLCRTSAIVREKDPLALCLYLAFYNVDASTKPLKSLSRINLDDIEFYFSNHFYSCISDSLGSYLKFAPVSFFFCHAELSKIILLVFLLKKKKNIISIQKACSAIIYMLPTVFTFLNSIVIKIFHLVCRACQTKCESNLEELHLCYVFLVTEKFSLCKEI